MFRELYSHLCPFLDFHTEIELFLHTLGMGCDRGRAWTAGVAASVTVNAILVLFSVAWLLWLLCWIPTIFFHVLTFSLNLLYISSFFFFFFFFFACHRFLQGAWRWIKYRGQRQRLLTNTTACSVCLDDFDHASNGSVGDGDEVVRLLCGHLFHEGCVRPWLESRGTCPCCRLSVGLSMSVVHMLHE